MLPCRGGWSIMVLAEENNQGFFAFMDAFTYQVSEGAGQAGRVGGRSEAGQACRQAGGSHCPTWLVRQRQGVLAAWGLQFANA